MEPSIDTLVIKKDFFIKSRSDDIRTVYEFSPKVLPAPLRSSAAEPTAWSTRRG